MAIEGLVRNEMNKIVIKNAWYLHNIDRIVVAELLNGNLVEFNVSPFKWLDESDFRPYNGSHPTTNKNNLEVAKYVLPCYGLRCAQR